MHLRDWIRTDWVQSAALLSLDVNFLDVNRNGETRSKARLISTPKPPIKVHFNCLHLQIDSFKLLYIFINSFISIKIYQIVAFFPFWPRVGVRLWHTLMATLQFSLLNPSSAFFLLMFCCGVFKRFVSQGHCPCLCPKFHSLPISSPHTVQGLPW